MNNTNPASARTMKITDGYDMRAELAQLGGKYRAADRSWRLTEAQYDALWDLVEASGKRSNKRDRSLYVAYERCTAEWI